MEIILHTSGLHICAFVYLSLISFSVHDCYNLADFGNIILYRIDIIYTYWMMKSILVVSHAMELGGAERALLGLLEHMDYSTYQVDLFLLRHQGELLKYIPEQVNLLPENASYSCLAVPICNVLKKGKFNIAYHRYLGKKYAKKRVQELNCPPDNGIGLEYSHKYTVRCMPPINEKEYDVAISFLTPHYFVRDKVRARKKIAWIHTDYSRALLLQWCFNILIKLCLKSFSEHSPLLAEQLQNVRKEMIE